MSLLEALRRWKMTTPPGEVPPHILSALEELRKPSSYSNSEKAVDDLFEYCRWKDKIPQSLTDAGFLETIISAMDHYGQSVSFYAYLIQMLGMYMISNEDCTEEIIEKGGLESVICLMDTFVTDETIQMTGVVCLFFFIQNSSETSAIEIATECTVTAMEIHKDSSAIAGFGGPLLVWASRLLEFSFSNDLMRRCKSCLEVLLSNYPPDSEELKKNIPVLVEAFDTLLSLRLQLEKLSNSSFSTSDAERLFVSVTVVAKSGLSRALVDGGFFEMTIASLNNGVQTQEVCERLCVMLALFMGLDEKGKGYTEQILRLGGLESALCVVNSFPEDERCQWAALKLYHFFCVNSIDTKKGADIANTALESTVKIMSNHEDSAFVLRSSCQTIREALVALDFSVNDEALFDQCINCVSSGVAKHWDDNESAVVGRSVLEGLIGADASNEMLAKHSMSHFNSQLVELRHPSRNPVKALAVAQELVSAIKEEKFPMSLVDADFLDTITCAMNHLGQSSMFYFHLFEVLTALMATVETQEDYTGKIVERGGFARMVGVMKSFVNDEDMQLIALSVIQSFVYEKGGAFIPAIIKNAAEAMHAHKDSTKIYSAGCRTLEHSLESTGWCVEDEQLLKRVVDCVWCGITNHPHYDDLQLRGRRLLHALVGDEAAKEMISKSEHRHCADADCSAAA